MNDLRTLSMSLSVLDLLLLPYMDCSAVYVSSRMNTNLYRLRYFPRLSRFLGFHRARKRPVWECHVRQIHSLPRQRWTDDFFLGLICLLNICDVYYYQSFGEYK